MLAPHLAALPPNHAAVELCGFGIVAAAARTAQLLAALRPERVILVGIAGGLDDRLAIGEATLFDSVACHGIGVGSGGWPALLFAARSRHPGAVVTTRADGSVHAVRDDVAPEVWTALGSMDGGDASTP